MENLRVLGNFLNLHIQNRIYLHKTSFSELTSLIIKFPIHDDSACSYYYNYQMFTLIHTRERERERERETWREGERERERGRERVYIDQILIYLCNRM